MHRRYCVLIALLFASPVAAAPVVAPHSRAELIAEHTHVSPGQNVTFAVRLQLEHGWHTYWKNPGDSGMPTTIAWTLPAGFTAGPLQWPAPARIETPPLVSYGYAKELWLLTDVHVPLGAEAGTRIPVGARADWLVCKEICIPASADLQSMLAVSAQPAAPDAAWSESFARARARIPAQRADWRTSVHREGDELVLRLQHEEPSGSQLRALTFFPERDGLIDNARAQDFSYLSPTYELRMAVAPQAVREPVRALAGVLVADSDLGGWRAAEVNVSVQEAPPVRSASTGLGSAFAFAFLGGLILNLMPCVFPVLAIKVLGVVQRTRGNRRSLRMHGLLFGAGVVASFCLVAALLLALRAGGAQIGWGYQLQSPFVVTFLAILFFLLALNLSGAFQVGTRLQTLAGAIRLRNTHADAFMSGLLATAVASPCTAPLMGAALAFALAQPVVTAMLVFVALALGMALPFVLLCFVPRLLDRLPRPGPWMETLRQLLAFPLYATVVWLIWVLGQQLGIDAAARLLAALTAFAAALWSVAHAGATRLGWSRIAGRIATVVLIAAGVALAWPHADSTYGSTTRSTDTWQRWSPAAVDQALAQGHPVFVDFTAAWCVTCQVNKRLVLQSDAVGRRFDERRVTRLRADWTNRDPVITAALQGLNRVGVPVYALYVPGRRVPILLPEILTHAAVLDALDALAPRASLSLSEPPQRFSQPSPETP